MWKLSLSSELPTLSTACAYCLICSKWIEQIVKYLVNHLFIGYDTRFFFNKHYHESEKWNSNFKKYSRNPFSGIICVQMAVLTNLTILLKIGVIIGKTVAGNVSVQNFVKFRSVVFEILMKMCFDFSISKAHSSVAKPKLIFFFCSCNLHLFFALLCPCEVWCSCVATPCVYGAEFQILSPHLSS